MRKTPWSMGPGLQCKSHLYTRQCINYNNITRNEDYNNKYTAWVYKLYNGNEGVPALPCTLNLIRKVKTYHLHRKCTIIYSTKIITTE